MEDVTEATSIFTYGLWTNTALVSNIFSKRKHVFYNDWVNSIRRSCLKTHFKAVSCQFYTASAVSHFKYGRKRWASIQNEFSEPSLASLAVLKLFSLMCCRLNVWYLNRNHCGAVVRMQCTVGWKLNLSFPVVVIFCRGDWDHWCC